jgi:hypothetical protein
MRPDAAAGVTLIRLWGADDGAVREFPVTRVAGRGEPVPLFTGAEYPELRFEAAIPAGTPTFRASAVSLLLEGEPPVCYLPLAPAWLLTGGDTTACSLSRHNHNDQPEVI